jgi:hypothetical protein
MSIPASIAQQHAAAAAPLVVDYYLHDDTLIIASAAIPGRLYVTTSNDCSCPAGLQELPCKHAELRLSLLRPHTGVLVVLPFDQADALF